MKFLHGAKPVGPQKNQSDLCPYQRILGHTESASATHTEREGRVRPQGKVAICRSRREASDATPADRHLHFTCQATKTGQNEMSVVQATQPVVLCHEGKYTAPKTCV
jgi:hypothetical protein